MVNCTMTITTTPGPQEAVARREVEHWVCGARAVEPLRAQLEHGLAVGEGVSAAAQPRRGLEQPHAGYEGWRSEVTGHYTQST